MLNIFNECTRNKCASMENVLRGIGRAAPGAGSDPAQLLGRFGRKGVVGGENRHPPHRSGCFGSSMERVGSCAWPSLSGGVFCCEENCVRSAVCLDVHRDASARKLVAEMLCHSVFLLLSIQTAVGLTHDRASSHCSEQYARTSLVVCEMCYVDSDCTRAKTPFLIVWTIVSPLFLVVAPLVTVGLGLCAAIHHVSYGCMSHNETVFGQALIETGYSALTSCARTLLGHRCV